MNTTELKEKSVDLMTGKLMLTKLDFCLIGAIMLFAGIAIGLILSPITKGMNISIFSNNGNDSANNNGNNCGSRIGGEADDKRNGEIEEKK